MAKSDFVTRETCDARHWESGDFAILKRCVLALAVTVSLTAVGFSVTAATQQARTEERVEANRAKIKEIREELRQLPGVLRTTIRAEFERAKGAE